MSRRRLAAIMFTDMVGYTALGQQNESLSLALVDEQRKLIRPILSRHHGREVKTMGDSFLAEFANALDAVRCAYDIQRISKEFNISQPVEARIRLRVGLHVGDVEEVDGDIFGDAVNVASRIEALAEDGGVCLTRQIHDQVQNKISLPFTPLGTRSLKNVSQPTEVYRMVMPWEEEKTTHSVLLDKKRIAVLPFANISPDPTDEYFADGTTEEMISTLSTIHDLSVISRTSVMQLKGAKKNLADIAKELRAGSLLEGSVRKVGNRVRITAQLLDVVEDKHLWTQSYDRELQDIFAVQSDIARSVADAVKARLLVPSSSLMQEKPTTSTEAYLDYLKGRQERKKSSEEGLKRAIEYYDRALRGDPNFALAYAALAESYLFLIDRRGIPAGEGIAKAKSAVLKALELNEGLAEAHVSYGLLLHYDWNYDQAEAEYRRAIELNPSYATAHQWYSSLLNDEGFVEKALAESQKGLELDPLSSATNTNLGIAFEIAERYDEAIECFRRSLAIQPNVSLPLAGLIIAYAEKGESGTAVEWLEEYSRVDPEKARTMVWRAFIQARAGEKTEALESIESALRLPSSAKIPPTWVAWVFAALGEEERALDWLEKALDQRDPYVTSLKYPIFRGLRRNPRYLEILKKAGLDRY